MLTTQAVKTSIVWFLILLTWSYCASTADFILLETLDQFYYPITALLVTFAVSTGVLGLLFGLGVLEYQNPFQHYRISQCAIVSLCQVLGFFTTYIAYDYISISLTQTIKSTEPIFTLLLTIMLTGTSPSLGMTISIVPIVLGVVLTSFGDTSFNALGVAMAITSNIVFSCRAILSKPLMTPAVNQFNTYMFFSFTAVLLLLPVYLAFDLPRQLGFHYLEYIGLSRQYVLWNLDIFSKNVRPDIDVHISFWHLMYRLGCVGIYNLVYSMLSFYVLGMVDPVTHSVLNISRRVIAVVLLNVWFGTIPQPLSILGMIIVLLGIISYALAQSVANKKAGDLEQPHDHRKDSSGVKKPIVRRHSPLRPKTETHLSPVHHRFESKPMSLLDDDS